MRVGGPKVKVIQNPEDEVPKEILAQAIVRISQSVTSLKKSGMNQRAIVALVRDYTGYTINKGTVETVLNALSELQRMYC